MKRRTFVKRRTLGLAQENTSKTEDKTSSVVEIILAILRHYIIRRLVFFLFVIWLAATVIFIIPRLSGQDPVKEKLLLEAQRGGALQTGLDEMAKTYQKRFGLDRPMYIQYGNFLFDLVRFDLGTSIAYYPRSVASIVYDSILWTIGLVGTVTLLAFSIGTLAGAFLGWPRRPGWIQYLFMPLLTLSAIPQYLLGLILIFIFAFHLEWLPLFGAYKPGTVPNLSWDFVFMVLRHAILPACAILLAAVGFWAIGMRGMMINTQGEDFMIQADAKGLKGARIFLRYAIRNALLPQVTGVAISLGTIITGAILVERVFLYPGLGDILFQAIRLSDFFLIRGIVMTIVFSIAVATLILDLIYPLIDPRIRTNT